MKLATEILREEKKKATFWKVATMITLAIIVIETAFILFWKGGVLRCRTQRKPLPQRF